MKRSLHEETFIKEKYAKYNDSSSQVVLILHDFKMVPNELHQHLTRKFQNQSKGKAKWLIRKEEILNNNGDQKDNPLPSFIPIEFSDDVQVIVHLIGKTITYKSANCTITDKNMRKLITKELKERDILLEKNLNIEKTLLEFKTIHDLWKLYEYSFLLYNPKFMLEMSKKFQLFLFHRFVDYLVFLSDDKEFILELMKIQLSAVYLSSVELQNNVEFLRLLIEQEPAALIYLTKCEELLKSRLITEIKEKLSNLVRSDKETILKYVRFDFSLIDTIPNELKSDKEFIRSLIKSTPTEKLPDLISMEWRDDLDFMKEVVKEDPSLYEIASQRLKELKEFALLVVFEDDIEFPDSLWQDKEFIIELVKIDFYAYEKVPEHLRNDEEVAIASLHCMDNKELIPQHFLHDRNFILRVKRACVFLDLNDLPAGVVDDELIFECLEIPDEQYDFNDAYILIAKSGRIQNMDFMRKAMQRGYKYSCLPDNLRGLREFVELAVNYRPHMLTQLQPKFRFDTEIQKIAVKKNGFYQHNGYKLYDYRMECEYFGCQPFS